MPAWIFLGAVMHGCDCWGGGGGGGYPANDKSQNERPKNTGLGTCVRTYRGEMPRYKWSVMGTDFVHENFLGGRISHEPMDLD